MLNDNWEIGGTISHRDGNLGCITPEEPAGHEEVWRFRKTGEGEPVWFIEAVGKRNLRISHAHCEVSLTDASQGGEKWTIVENEPEVIRIKGLSGERDHYMSHDDGFFPMMVHRDTHEGQHRYFRIEDATGGAFVAHGS